MFSLQTGATLHIQRLSALDYLGALQNRNIITVLIATKPVTRSLVNRLPIVFATSIYLLGQGVILTPWLGLLESLFWQVV